MCLIAVAVRKNVQCSGCGSAADVRAEVLQLVPRLFTCLMKLQLLD